MCLVLKKHHKRALGGEKMNNFALLLNTAQYSTKAVTFATAKKNEYQDKNLHKVRYLSSR